MLLTLDLNDGRPLHEQVAGSIRRAIAEGSTRRATGCLGTELRPKRSASTPARVLRALREMREEGLLEFRRGRGVSVARQADGRALIRERTRELLEEAKRYGYRAEDVITILKELP